MLASAATGNTSGEATIPTSNIRLEAMRQFGRPGAETRPVFRNTRIVTSIDPI